MKFVVLDNQYLPIVSEHEDNVEVNNGNLIINVPGVSVQAVNNIIEANDCYPHIDYCANIPEVGYYTNEQVHALITPAWRDDTGPSPVWRRMDEPAYKYHYHFDEITQAEIDTLAIDANNPARIAIIQNRVKNTITHRPGNQTIITLVSNP